MCTQIPLKTLAQFSVLSRLKEPDNSSIYSKMRVYDGETLKDTDPKAKSYPRISRLTLALMKVCQGLSTRFAFKILSRVFNFDNIEIAANPVHLFYVLRTTSRTESNFPKETT